MTAPRIGHRFVIRLSALVLGTVVAASAHAQASLWPEVTVGSEGELYLLALAARGLAGNEPRFIGFLAPGVSDALRKGLTAPHPWSARFPAFGSVGAAASPAGASRIEWLRPSLSLGYNGSFAWGMNDGPVWQGKGANVWTTFGATWRRGGFSARVEPLIEYAQNAAFQLEGSAFADPVRPGSIDLPQRFGPDAVTIVSPGESYVRYDAGRFGAGLSTERIFWGPGVRHAILSGPNAAGFPHLFLGTNRAVETRAGAFAAQVIYAQLSESDYAPAAPNPKRLGAGAIATWQPIPVLTLGLARFYHRAWPDKWSASDYTLPFGAFFSRVQAAGSGISDNQLASVFFTVRAPRAGLEVFGEFGKNDRHLDSRDLLIEPEHNSAWLLGFLKVIGATDSDAGFWTVRMEAANGRVVPLRDIGRGQSTFYEHSRITQGHTQRGQLLGTPLIDRSGGAEFSVDRYTNAGRVGVTVVARQMPPDLEVGLPADGARSQWDIGVNGSLFRGAADITFRLGNVWDLNRFPGRDASNPYLGIGARLSAERIAATLRGR
ncbi:MAG: hypothetical protein O2973_12765 [Gemmatimonadetes bacterium]|nr:hypothetical protein [Gemmatimonadota bacterium]